MPTRKTNGDDIATSKQVNIGSLAGIITQLATLGVIVGFATSIQAHIDSAKNVSVQNCNLLKAAIILSIEQSKTSKTDPGTLDTIRRNFEGITCDG